MANNDKKFKRKRLSSAGSIAFLLTYYAWQRWGVYKAFCTINQDSKNIRFWLLFQGFQTIIQEFWLITLFIAEIPRFFGQHSKINQNMVGIPRFLIDIKRFLIDKPGLLLIFQDFWSIFQVYQSVFQIPRYSIDIPRFSTEDIYLIDKPG